VKRAERLRAGDSERGGASWAVQARASSPDAGADGGIEEEAMDVVSGGEPEGGPGAAEHAPGAAGVSEGSAVSAVLPRERGDGKIRG
jgi:hypothetical protein